MEIMGGMAFIEIFGGMIFLAVIGFFVYIIIKLASEKARNDASPVETRSAVVTAKRTKVSGGAGDAGVSTTYYVTFESEGGGRREFRVRGDAYGALAEGDRGVLSYQGTRYLGFDRSEGAYEAADPANAVHKCEACGATFRGRVCEYCGTPFENTAERIR